MPDNAPADLEKVFAQFLIVGNLRCEIFNLVIIKLAHLAKRMTNFSWFVADAVTVYVGRSGRQGMTHSPIDAPPHLYTTTGCATLSYPSFSFKT